MTNEPGENTLPVRIGMEGAFNGIIDEVIILDVALEADDIKTPPPTQLRER